MSVRASVANARAFGANPVAFYRDISGAGDGYRTVVPFDMFGPNLLVNDPELAGTVLLSPDGGDFGKDGLRFFAVIRRMLGTGVFTVDGEAHRRQRRFVQPILRPRLLGAATEAMTRAAQRLRDGWAGGGERVVDVQAAASRTAVELLAEGFAGRRRAAEVRELAELSLAAEGPMLHVLKAPVVFPERLPTPANRRLARASRALRERAEELVRRSDADPPAPGSLLAQLLERARVSGTSHADLIDELLTLVVAGHQSTAAAIAFTFYALATNPDPARRVEREAAEVLDGRAATAADLPRLRHARMAVDEAIRMYPPVWIITRRVVRGIRLGDRELRAGTIVHISPYTLHRHPGHWPEPERFRPERFAGSGDQHRFAYAPFGGGPYKCLGNHLALAATTIVVATVCAAVRFAAPQTEVRVSARSFLIAENGLRLTIGG
jgi:enediyne biosynthesis protein E7